MIPIEAVDPSATVGPDPAWGFPLGGALFILGVTMLWKAVHLRGATHQRLKAPVDLAYEGLAVRIIELLGELRKQIDEIIPPIGAAFDPIAVIADPGVVSPLARKGIRLMRERRSLLSQLNALLVICSVLKYFAAAFVLLVFASTCLYFFVYATPMIWQSACWITAGVAALGTCLIIVYAALDARIQGAIEHADEPGARAR